MTDNETLLGITDYIGVAVGCTLLPFGTEIEITEDAEARVPTIRIRF